MRSSRNHPLVSRRVHLVGLFGVLAVDVLVVISDFKERLHDYGLKFYAALQGVDPFYALKGWFSIMYCGLLDTSPHSSWCIAVKYEQHHPTVSPLGLVLGVICFVLSVSIFLELSIRYERKTGRSLNSPNLEMFFMVVGTSVLLWILRVSLFAAAQAIGWASGFFVWGNAVCVCGVLGCVHAHHIYKSGREIRELIKRD
jgi:hypothetical protein